jgi:hypothetical protein
MMSSVGQEQRCWKCVCENLPPHGRVKSKRPTVLLTWVDVALATVR